PAAQPAVWMRVPRPRARVRREGTETRVEERGVILAFDAFGNAITNLRRRRGFRLARLRTGSLETRRLARTYADAEPGGAVALEGSSGYLEVAVRDGSAERELALERGQAVAAEWRRREEPGRRAARRQSGPTG
ncbi:MAG: SAM hydroxide adenosyltransferase, partial [Planctomycetota bacterium]